LKKLVPEVIKAEKVTDSTDYSELKSILDALKIYKNANSGDNQEA